MPFQLPPFPLCATFCGVGMACVWFQALAKSVEDGGKARQATESQLEQWQARESMLLLEQVK